jgi:hypothetical protein
MTFNSINLLEIIRNRHRNKDCYSNKESIIKKHLLSSGLEIDFIEEFYVNRLYQGKQLSIYIDVESF